MQSVQVFNAKCSMQSVQVFNAKCSKCSSVQCKVLKCSMQGVQCKVLKVFKSQPSQCRAITSSQPASYHNQMFSQSKVFTIKCFLSKIKALNENNQPNVGSFKQLAQLPNSQCVTCFCLDSSMQGHRVSILPQSNKSYIS